MNTNKSLKRFSDEELKAELVLREQARIGESIKKEIGKRKPIGYFYFQGGDERHTDWELHIVFDNGTKKCFSFSNAYGSGQTENTRDVFREVHFPNLPAILYTDWCKMRKASC